MLAECVTDLDSLPLVKSVRQCCEEADLTTDFYSCDCPSAYGIVLFAHAHFACTREDGVMLNEIRLSMVNDGAAFLLLKGRY